MLALEIFFEGRQVGVCYDARLIMHRGDPKLIAGLPTWSIEAPDVLWGEATDPSHYATSSAPLDLFIREGGQLMMEGQAFIQGIRTESRPNTRLVYHVDFVGQGMLMRTDGLRPIMDRTELDSAPWNIHDNIIIGDDPGQAAIGFAISESEKVIQQNRMREKLMRDIKELDNRIYSPVLIHKGNVDINNTPATGTKKRTKKSDREDSDKTPRGFRIVP